MNVLVKKMSSFGILRLQLILGAIVMVAAMVGMPLGIASGDASLLLNPYVLGVVIIGMLMFGAIAFFMFIRPYFIYRKSPEVLAETDGEYVYFHGEKEAKIPLSAFADATVTYHLPFFYSKELIAGILTYFFSDNYGDISIDVPGYGSYRLRFVAKAKESADRLLSYLAGVDFSPFN